MIFQSYELATIVVVREYVQVLESCLYINTLSIQPEPLSTSIKSRDEN